ncbi:hypothetical protein DdX_00628 [Ditylenchus destructor]|uniref:Uncharacterized protein n=1 Tax=Ditylenchus destructor TaxID=166010 RepID=A0AAD4NGU0_9BILA|nr:hypothetical protein DdX_00628 [Ditylenchus destructor]
MTDEISPGEKLFVDKIRALLGIRGDVFKGIRTREYIEQHLKKVREFALYYEYKSVDKLDDLTDLPLMLAYCSSNMDIYHYRVTCVPTKFGVGKQAWTVERSWVNKRFTSLRMLVDYYQDMYFVPSEENKHGDLFPPPGNESSSLESP